MNIKILFLRLAEKGHSVSFLDTIPINVATSKLRAIRFPLPKRNDEEWKNQFAQILWHKRLTSSDLGHYYTVMDNLLGIMLKNGTDAVN